MAIYHLSAKIISRSNGRGGVAYRVAGEVLGGRSVIAAAAYRSGTRMHDQRLDQTFDYRKKSVAEARIMLPEGAPEWAADRAQLWNTVEANERRVDSQLARELEIALPRELTPDQQRECLEGYLQKHCVDRGMVADYAIHREDPNNPHAHVLLTLRGLDGEGLGPKRREWNEKPLLLEWRLAWELAANAALARAGLDERVDHRSYAERGVTLEPAPKLYRASTHAATDAFVAERVQIVREVARRNGEKLEASPAFALSLLPQDRRVFTKRDLARVVSRHTDDPDQFQRVFAKVLAVEGLVDLGVGQDGQQRYARRDDLLAMTAERSIEALADHLGKETHHQVPARKVDAAIAAMAKTGVALSAEQVEAVRHIASNTGRLALVQGHAGTGKSVALGAARAAWEADGLKVVGGAIAGKAAEGLRDGSSIPSRTIASWLERWDNGKDLLDARSVLVIDEAGMVGNAQMQALLRAVSKAGGKLVLVGDHGQLQPIDEGTPLRALVDHMGAATMAHIRRQRVDWQVEASRALSAAKVSDALALYSAHGNIRAADTQAAAREAAVHAWVRDQVAHPKGTQLLLAYRRTDVADLNALARAYRVQAGQLKGGIRVAAKDGPLDVAVGERLYFLRNDAQLGVMNGSLGTVLGINKGLLSRVLTVELDSGAVVKVDAAHYKDLAHGYAATIHKAQGVTVDRAYVVADALFDRHATYVAMTRHRENAEVHYSREAFKTPEALSAALGQVARRDRGANWEDTKLLADHLDAGGRTSKTRDQVFAEMKLDRQEAHLARLRQMVRRPAPTPPPEPTPEAQRRYQDAVRWREVERREAQRELTRFEAIVAERRALEMAGASPEDVAQLRRQAALPASRGRAEWAVPEIRAASERLKEARGSLRTSRSYVARATAARRVAAAKHELELVRARPDVRRRVESIRAEQHHRQVRALRVHARRHHAQENPMTLHKSPPSPPFAPYVPQSNLRHHLHVDDRQALREGGNAHALRTNPETFTRTLPSTFTRKELAEALAPHVSAAAAPALLHELHERRVLQSLGVDQQGVETFTAEPFGAGARDQRFADLPAAQQQASLTAALSDFYSPAHDADLELARDPLLVGTLSIVEARGRAHAAAERALERASPAEVPELTAGRDRATAALDEAISLHQSVVDDPHRLAHHRQLEVQSVTIRAAGAEHYTAHRQQFVETFARQFDGRDPAGRDRAVAQLHRKLEPLTVIPVPDHFTPQQGVALLLERRNALSTVPAVREALSVYQAAAKDAGVTPSAKAVSAVLDAAAQVVLVSKAPQVIVAAEASAQRSMTDRTLASDLLRHLHTTRGVTVAHNKLEERLEWQEDALGLLVKGQDRRVHLGLEAGTPVRDLPNLEHLQRGPVNSAALRKDPSRILSAINPAGEVLTETEFLRRLHDPRTPTSAQALYAAAVDSGHVVRVQPLALRGERLVVPATHPMAVALSPGPVAPTLAHQVDRAALLIRPTPSHPWLEEHPTVVGIRKELAALRTDDLSPRAVAARVELPARIASIAQSETLQLQHRLLNPEFPRKALLAAEFPAERIRAVDEALDTQLATLPLERQRTALESGLGQAAHIQDPARREERRLALQAQHGQAQLDAFTVKPLSEQARAIQSGALPENLASNLRLAHEHAQQKWFVALPTTQQANVLANLKREAGREPTALTAAADVPALRRPLEAYNTALELAKGATEPDAAARAARAVTTARNDLQALTRVPAIQLQVAGALRAQSARRDVAQKDLSFYQTVALRITRNQGLQR